MELEKTIIELWRSLVILALLYFVPYLIAKGYYEGKYSSVDKKKLCDICWRDINKVNEYFEKQNKQSI